MHNESLCIGDDGVVKANQIIAICTCRLACVDSVVIVIVDDAVLSELDSFEGKADKYEQKGKCAGYRYTYPNYLKPVLHL
jgi:hypothetical protein